MNNKKMTTDADIRYFCPLFSYFSFRGSNASSNAIPAYGLMPRLFNNSHNRVPPKRHKNKSLPCMGQNAPMGGIKVKTNCLFFYRNNSGANSRSERRQVSHSCAVPGDS